MTRHALLALLLLSGCMSKLEEQTKPTGSIIGKTTQDIGKFDPAAKAKVSDSAVRATDPVTAPLSAYGPMLEQISKTHIEHALRLYEATNGRYPKDYDEFMQEIIKANNIKLPVLPGNMMYQYDEKEHKLVVVEKPAAAPPAP